MSSPDSIDIQCTLPQTELEKRLQGDLKTLFDQALATEALQNGRAFQFPGSPEMMAELFQFVRVERQCCAFFQFELVFEPQLGPIWLKLTGGEGVRSFIDSQMM